MVKEPNDSEKLVEGQRVALSNGNISRDPGVFVKEANIASAAGETVVRAFELAP